MATYQFQTEVNQLLKLIIHSMYSNKDIFLREIVSNASDALDKLKYLTVSDDAFKDVHFAPRIDISFEGGDEGKESVLTVQDSGIGMTDKDLTDNLGTIARSGTKAFFEKLNEAASKDSALIGQFGVGFYAAFMAAKKSTYTRGKRPIRPEKFGTGRATARTRTISKKSHATAKKRKNTVSIKAMPAAPPSSCI